MFIAVEGMSGAGKTTLTALLVQKIAAEGKRVLATAEPSESAIGTLARASTHGIRGRALACLVAADRFHHVESEIQPALDNGTTVVCDRFVASSLVLQTLDGVPIDFLLALHEGLRYPDLTIVLHAVPDVAQRRARARGGYSRFHYQSQEFGNAEAAGYRSAAQLLRARGERVTEIEVAALPAAEVARRAVAAVQRETSAR